MIIYIYNIYIYMESISLSHMTLWYYDNLVYIFVGTTVSLIFCYIFEIYLYKSIYIFARV